MGVGRYILDTVSPPPKSYTTQEIVNETVKQMIPTLALPKIIDEATTLVNVTPEINAIRYHYRIEGIDTKEVTNGTFREMLLPVICQNKDTRDGLLRKGINMEYSYVVKETNENFFVSITNGDCQ